MKIQESAENYLETILVLSKKKGSLRAIDIVNELNYKKSSVSVAMKNLRESGFISVDERGFIALTSQGKAIAEAVYERHTIITKWLTSIGVEEAIASEDACRIEHVISKESFEAIKKLLDD